MIYQNHMEDDFFRLKRFYPEISRSIMPFVEKACDEMDYSGSRMYDESPDKNMIYRLCDSIYDEMDYTFLVPEEEDCHESMDCFAMSYCKNNNMQAERLIKELIAVLLYTEMLQRRCCHNQCRMKNGCYKLR